MGHKKRVTEKKQTTKAITFGITHQWEKRQRLRKKKYKARR